MKMIMDRMTRGCGFPNSAGLLTRCASWVLLGSAFSIKAIAAAATSPALTAVGCAQAEPQPPSNMRSLPGQIGTDLRVVAALLGSPDADSLGSLCVAVVRPLGGGFTVVARLPEDKQPEPPSDVDHVTSTQVAIDAVPYRFAPTEVAFAVRVSGEFDSTSTEVSWERLYLFRRTGNRVSLIFHAETDTSETDKMSTESAETHRRIVRFSTALHNGGYDLILAQSHSRDFRRFVWSGSTYLPANGKINQD